MERDPNRRSASGRRHKTRSASTSKRHHQVHSDHEPQFRTVGTGDRKIRIIGFACVAAGVLIIAIAYTMVVGTSDSKTPPATRPVAQSEAEPARAEKRKEPAIPAGSGKPQPSRPAVPPAVRPADPARREETAKPADKTVPEPSPARPFDPSSDLILHLKLDEIANGVTPDSSPSQAHAAVGELKIVAGRIGGALYFDGSEKFATIKNTPELDRIQSEDFSISLWFKPDKLPVGKKEQDSDFYYSLICKIGSNAGIFYGPKGRFVFRHWPVGKSAFTRSANTFSAGKWYHVAATVKNSSGVIKLYVNGEFNGMTGFEEKAPIRDYGNTPWRLGVGLLPGSINCVWPAMGAIDDVRIYRRVLTDEEVAVLAKAGS